MCFFVFLYIGIAQIKCNVYIFLKYLENHNTKKKPLFWNGTMKNKRDENITDIFQKLDACEDYQKNAMDIGALLKESFWKISKIKMRDPFTSQSLSVMNFREELEATSKVKITKIEDENGNPGSIFRLCDDLSETNNNVEQPNTDRNRDPLFLAGIFPPPKELRQAQSGFRQALQLLIDNANIAKTMIKKDVDN